MTAPVLVLGNTGIDGARICAQNGITQAVCDADGVRRMQRACEELRTTAGVHLKCDTGMSRIGVRSEEEVRQVLDALNECPAVKLTGAFMHFAAADGDEAFARKQFDTFMRLTAPLPAGIIRHAAASDASIRFPWARLDMVREGISLYGCPGVQSGIPLRYAMRFETRVEFIKTLPAGETVGYGRTWTASRETRVATLGVGYGDGYLRSASGKAQVLIGGQMCPVIGRVCMDQIMVDVTDVPGVKEGDCAVLMGRQGETEITPDQLAAWAGTISYEVMLSPHPRVPVLYYEEGK